MMSLTLLFLAMGVEVLNAAIGDHDVDHEESFPHVEMRTRLIQFGIMPDVIEETPKYLIEIVYGEYYSIRFGNKVNPDFCCAPPKMKWPTDPEKFYTLLMVDPDHPSRLTPTDREFLLWLVVNVPGYKRMFGHTVAEYRPPEIDPGTGPHRFVYVVYEQPMGKIKSEEPYSDVFQNESRQHFNTKLFAKKYALGTTPLAVNFFLGEKLLKNDSTALKSPTSTATIGKTYNTR